VRHHWGSDPPRVPTKAQRAAVNIWASAARSLLAETVMASSMATAALGAAPALRSRCVPST